MSNALERLEDMRARLPTSKFLVYSCFDTPTAQGGTVAGSLLLDCAVTREEAEEKMAMYKERMEAYDRDHPTSTRSRYCIINNNPEWWPENRGPAGAAATALAAE